MLTVACYAILKVQSPLYSIKCNVDMYSITICNKLNVCSKRYDSSIYLVMNSRTVKDKCVILCLNQFAVQN
jgi:hypothetical protein